MLHKYPLRRLCAHDLLHNLQKVEGVLEFLTALCQAYLPRGSQHWLKIHAVFQQPHEKPHGKGRSSLHSYFEEAHSDLPEPMFAWEALDFLEMFYRRLESLQQRKERPGT